MPAELTKEVRAANQDASLSPGAKEVNLTLETPGKLGLNKGNEPDEGKQQKRQERKGDPRGGKAVLQKS